MKYINFLIKSFAAGAMITIDGTVFLMVYKRCNFGYDLSLKSQNISIHLRRVVNKSLFMLQTKGVWEKTSKLLYFGDVVNISTNVKH